MGTIPFALQLYSVRDHLGKDLAGTLKRVKDIGYDYVEVAGMPRMTAAECKGVLDDSGLQPISSHVPYDVVTGQPDQAIEDAVTLGIKYVVVPWIGGKKMVPDKDAWVACGKALDEAGARLREGGVQLCYHNHAHEFERFDGEFIYDILLGAAKSENLAVEPDTYWIKYGGVDPVTVIEKYSGRCPLLHIKDMAAGEERAMVEVGRGTIDWKPILAAGADAGTQWYIVEQDESSRDSLESAKISAAFMAKQ